MLHDAARAPGVGPLPNLIGLAWLVRRLRLGRAHVPLPPIGRRDDIKLLLPLRRDARIGVRLDVWRCGPLMLAYVAVFLGGVIDSPVRDGAAWMAQTDEPKIPAPLSGHNSGLPVQDAFVA
jgi:hypothetical protein